VPNKQPVFTKRAPRPGGGYSQAVAVGDFVFTAGMGPIDPATGGVVGHDVATQTHQVMRNLAAVLAEAGVDLADVVKTTVHLQNLKHDFHQWSHVYAPGGTVCEGVDKPADNDHRLAAIRTIGCYRLAP
jgi:2-iminobutanoate/2-iminopropanoate deaminase